jgi:hypothetical protein
MKLKQLKLNELVVGKTIETITYLDHEFVGIGFTDGTYVRIDQRSQSGSLHVNCLLGTETVVRIAEPDNTEADEEKEEWW